MIGVVARHSDAYALKSSTGHVNQSHDLHLLSNHLLALRARGVEVDVQIANQDGVSAAGALKRLNVFL